ncbi:MAG: IS3 family transposase [Gemmatimonadetes bacterium]|nr:IS3 family transposase [Gemmatimonadota bacterium]
MRGGRSAAARLPLPRHPPLAAAVPVAGGAPDGAAPAAGRAGAGQATLGQSAVHLAAAAGGWEVNHKRIERLVREERLLVGQRPPAKPVAVSRVPTPMPTRPDQRWSMDFVRDTTAEGRPFRVWTLVDDATRECPLLLVDRSLPAWRVVEALDMLLVLRRRPLAIVCDNGPEFVSQALDHWASRQGIHLDFIRPGHPVENCFIESFNGKLRDECLSQYHFATLAEARHRIEQWRQEYNTERPHSSLGEQHPSGVRRTLHPRGGALLNPDPPILSGPETGEGSE